MPEGKGILVMLRRDMEQDGWARGLVAGGWWQWGVRTVMTEHSHD